MISTPKGFEPDFLDDPTILFLNTSILLDLRREWRFLNSTKTHGIDFDNFFGAIEYQGLTILVLTTPDGDMVGLFTSTSWLCYERRISLGMETLTSLVGNQK